MNRSAKFALFFVLGLALLFSPHASFAYYASAPTANKYSTTITPSKKSFGAGETITLTGHVTPYEEGRKLQIIVRDSSNDIVVLKTAPVSSDGTFTYEITDTTQWKKGNYKVAAQYGYDDTDIGTASFSFDPTVKAEPIKAVEKTDVKKDTKKKEVKKKTVKEVKKPKKTVKAKTVKK